MTRPQHHPIKVLLAEDHFLIRAGLKQLIEQSEDLIVVAEACDGVSTLAELDANPNLDIVLMDLLMPEPSGPDLIRKIRGRFPALPTLIVSVHDGSELIAQSIKAGGNGFITKNVPPETMRKAIRQVAFGGTWFDQSIMNQLMDYGSETASLSKREREVLQLIAMGQRNNQIAKALFISEKTVSTHKSNLMQKLNKRSTADLVRYADELFSDKSGSTFSD
jgi:DNA-binding NarL/FixJ family response regulator